MEQEQILVRKKTEAGFMMFLKGVIDASERGYQPDWDNFMSRSKPHFNNAFCITVYKKNPPPSTGKDLGLSILENKTTTKEDMLALAEKFNIQVPEDKAKYPAALRKFLKQEVHNNNK